MNHRLDGTSWRVGVMNARVVVILGAWVWLLSSSSSPLLPCCHGFLVPEFATTRRRPAVFTQQRQRQQQQPRPSCCVRLQAKSSKSGSGDDVEEPHWLMSEYRDPTTGQVLDPYQVLKVHRKADRQEIKQAYRNLSRRYHPDGVLHRDILPGSCNNLQDVRNHWERVKLSYEILSDPLRRKRYDRNEAWTDPGRAVQRAATEAALGAVVSAGKGVWGFGTTLGSSVLQGVSQAAEQARRRQETKPQPQQQLQGNHTTTSSSSSSGPTATVASIMKWKPTNPQQQQQQQQQRGDRGRHVMKLQVETAFRARISRTLEAARENQNTNVSSSASSLLFRQATDPPKPKNRGLRSLYDLGVVPLNNKNNNSKATASNHTAMESAIS